MQVNIPPKGLSGSWRSPFGLFIRAVFFGRFSSGYFLRAVLSGLFFRAFTLDPKCEHIAEEGVVLFGDRSSEDYFYPVAQSAVYERTLMDVQFFSGTEGSSVE